MNIDKQIEKLVLEGKTDEEIVNMNIIGYMSGEFNFVENLKKSRQCDECGKSIEQDYCFTITYDGGMVDYYHPACGKQILKWEIQNCERLIGEIESHYNV